MNNESGRNMIEMLGVLAIIGVLSVGGIAGYSKAMYRLKMNKTIDIMNRALHDLEEFTSHRLDEGELGMFKWWGVDEEHGLADYLDSLKDICSDREYENVRGNIGYSCPLPIGEADFYLETYDHVKFGTMGNFAADVNVYFNGPEKVQACVDFVSHNWTNVVPDEWFTYINSDGESGGIDINGVTVYGPSEGIFTCSLADITNACAKCEENDTFCHVWVYFYRIL